MEFANLKKHKDTVHKSRKCIQNVVLKIGNALIYLFPLSEFHWKNFRGKLEIHSNFNFFFQNSIDKNISDRLNHLNRLKLPETLGAKYREI